MLNSKSFQYVLSFVVSWLSLCFVFPHIPGISFNGTVSDGLGLTVIETLIFLGIIAVVVVALLVVGIVFMVRGSNFNKSTVTAWVLKQGFWKLTACSWAISIVLGALTWKSAAAFSQTLTIDGWLPIIIGTTFTALISSIPKVITRPNEFSQKHFEAELQATLAKELAEEAAEHKGDDNK